MFPHLRLMLNPDLAPECDSLGCYIFETIQEAQDHATRWLWTYNNERPNMGIGGITPMQKLKMVA